MNYSLIKSNEKYLLLLEIIKYKYVFYYNIKYSLRRATNIHFYVVFFGYYRFNPVAKKYLTV